MFIKEMIERRLKKNYKVTVYSRDNIPLVLSKEFRICRADPAPELEFGMDFADMADFCKTTDLTINPINHH